MFIQNLKDIVLSVYSTFKAYSINFTETADHRSLKFYILRNFHYNVKYIKKAVNAKTFRLSSELLTGPCLKLRGSSRKCNYL